MLDVQLLDELLETVGSASLSNLSIVSGGEKPEQD